ncbi:hypothetical protein [Streptomyces sp. NBC_01264]|uniref:hypothetical protein n=1 Tax=Streptomyces sp. NBC_01264 TaxID=2903804 RepID=UPI002256E81B|nr:hypothetical protein [Streptomyces sp. NBC_01264]MCX4776146.1 hypothetical protein [Streptomyces sp. NBC_01264]
MQLPAGASRPPGDAVGEPNRHLLLLECVLREDVEQAIVALDEGSPDTTTDQAADAAPQAPRPRTG